MTDRKSEPVLPIALAGEEIEHCVRNWTEDYAHENGQYINRCIDCKKTFVGHKRRVTCRCCAADAVASVSDAASRNEPSTFKATGDPRLDMSDAEFYEQSRKNLDAAKSDPSEPLPSKMRDDIREAHEVMWRAWDYLSNHADSAGALADYELRSDLFWEMVDGREATCRALENQLDEIGYTVAGYRERYIASVRAFEDLEGKLEALTAENHALRALATTAAETFGALRYAFHPDDDRAKELSKLRDSFLALSDPPGK